MSAQKWDIIVVGAGPAGSMAALHAARGGRRVCLVERKKNVGLPVRCGEGIGLKGLSSSMEVNPGWIRTVIKRASFISPSGLKVDMAKMGESYIINREIMESDLVRQATSAGATYLNETNVTELSANNERSYRCVTSGGELSAPCIILAEGIESRLARNLGWNTTLAAEDVESCAFCRVSHQSIAGDTVLFYVGSVYAPGGFVWVFPRGDGSANVGLGFLGTFHTPGLSREYLLRFVARFFPGAVPSDIHCGGVPVGRWLKPLVRDGVMLVGDAARQVNCLNGAGIAYGMNAGRNAGETAARAFDGTGCDWNKLKQYEKTWASSLGRQQVRSYVLKKTLLTKNNDAFYDTVARSFAGADPENLDYTRIFLKAFARHPLLLVKVILLFR